MDREYLKCIHCRLDLGLWSLSRCRRTYVTDVLFTCCVAHGCCVGTYMYVCPYSMVCGRAWSHGRTSQEPETLAHEIQCISVSLSAFVFICRSNQTTVPLSLIHVHVATSVDMITTSSTLKKMAAVSITLCLERAISPTHPRATRSAFIPLSWLPCTLYVCVCLYVDSELVCSMTAFRTKRITEVHL